MKKLSRITTFIVLSTVMLVSTVFAVGWHFFNGQSAKDYSVAASIDDNQWKFTFSPKALLVNKTVYLVYDANTYNIGDTYKGGTINNRDLNFDRSISAGFFRSSSPTSVIIEPSFIDYKPTDTESWFDSLRQLTSITGLEYLDTSNVIDMTNMFYYCNNLTQVDVSSFNTSKVLDMTGMFRYCSKITELDLSSFDTKKTSKMSYMFSSCSALRTIYADPLLWNTASVTQGSSMFSGCNNLIGGNGTTFNSSNVSFEMAVLDGYNGKVGYLTDISQKS